MLTRILAAACAALFAGLCVATFFAVKPAEKPAAYPFEAKAVEFFEAVKAGDLKAACKVTHPDFWLAQWVEPADCQMVLSRSALAAGPLEYQVVAAVKLTPNWALVVVKWRTNKDQWHPVSLYFALDRASYTSYKGWVKWQQIEPGPRQGVMRWRLYQAG